MESDDVILAHIRRMRFLSANCRQWKKCNHKCSGPPLCARTSQPLALQTATWLAVEGNVTKRLELPREKKSAVRCLRGKQTVSQGERPVRVPVTAASYSNEWRTFLIERIKGAFKRSESKLHSKFNGQWYSSRLHPHDPWIRVITIVWLYKKCLKRIVMYSYCYVCSVLYILFSSCQLALFGYPDWGFSVLFPQQ